MSEDKQPLSAFPHPKDGGAWGNDPITGMTMLDAYAMRAPITLAEASLVFGLGADPRVALQRIMQGDDALLEAHAILSYAWARCMMAERGKK